MVKLFPIPPIFSPLVSFSLGFLLPGRMSEERVVLGGFDRAEQRLALVRNLVLAACGTSLYASMYGAKLMRDLEALDTATVRRIQAARGGSAEAQI